MDTKTYAATDAATRAATRAAIRAATSAATDDTIRAAIRAAADDATDEEADGLFQDFDIHAAQAYRRWLDHVDAVNDACSARGLVRPVRRWWQQLDTLVLIAASLFAGLTALAAAIDPAALARFVGVL